MCRIRAQCSPGTGPRSFGIVKLPFEDRFTNTLAFGVFLPFLGSNVTQAMPGTFPFIESVPLT